MRIKGRTDRRALVRQPWAWALGTAAASAAGAFGIASYTVNTMNGPHRPSPLDDFVFSPFEVQVEHEDAALRTVDGVTLSAWWFPRNHTHRVVIGCTGHRGAKHELLGIGSGLWRSGHNVLLFDFRGCGQSQRVPRSLAFHEVADVHAACAYVQRRVPRARIGLIGYSMGGAVAILAAANNEVVTAVVADSAFAEVRDVVAHAYQRYRLPGGVVSLADALNRKRAGYGFDDVRPIDAVSRVAPRPLLLIHGERDAVIPVEHAQRLYNAAREPRQLWIVPEAAHCGAYFVDRREYVLRVSAFFESALDP